MRLDGHMDGSMPPYGPETVGERSVRPEAAFGAEVTERDRMALETSRSEGHLRSILEMMPAAFFAVDMEWRITFLNDVAAGIMRKPKEALLGADLWTEFPEAVDTPFYEAGLKAMNERVVVDTEAYYPPFGIWVEVHAFPVQDGLSVYFRDVSARKRVERRLVAQYAVTRSLAEPEAPSEALQRTLRGLCETFGWEFGALWRVDREVSVLRCTEAWHRGTETLAGFENASRQLAVGPGLSLVGRVWADARAVWLADAAEDERYLRAPSAATHGLHGAAAFPILIAGEARGVMEFVSSEPIRPDEDLIELMSAVGVQVGHFLQRAEAEEAVRASEARKTAIMESALDAIVSIDQRGTIVEFNPAAEAMFRLRREDAIGREMAEVIVPEADRERHRLGLFRYLQTGAANIVGRRVEMQALRADGTEFPVEIAVTRVDLPGAPMFTGYIRDITQRRQAEDRLLAAERQYRTLVEQIPAVIYVDAIDEDSSAIYISPQVESMLGYSQEQWVRDPSLWRMILHPDDRDAVVAESDRTNRTGDPFVASYRLVAKDGRIVWIRDEAVMLRDEAGRPLFWQGVMVDVSDRHRMEAELRQTQERYRQLMEASPEAIVVIDLDAKIRIGNANAVELFGVDGVERLLGKALVDFVDPADHQEMAETALKTFETGSVRNVEFTMVRGDGSRIPAELSASLVPDREGHPDGFVCVVRDITERKRVHEELRRLALLDDLTGLNNRRAFLALGEHELAAAKRKGSPVTLLFVDVDGMKDINDRLGHLEGDQALIDTARVLTETFRESDVIARVGGDEFCVLLSNGSDEHERLLSRLQETLSWHNAQGGRPYLLSLSVGAGRREPTERVTMEELIDRADRSMYRDKLGKGPAEMPPPKAEATEDDGSADPSTPEPQGNAALPA